MRRSVASERLTLTLTLTSTLSRGEGGRSGATVSFSLRAGVAP
jgi:hypothetical protein